MEEDNSFNVASFMKALRIVSIGLFLYAGYCLVHSPIVRQQAEDVPRMSCDELIRNGPGDHRYVALTDACLSDGKSVSQRDIDTGALELYHPLYAAQLKEEPPPRELGLILCIMDEGERRRIRDERDERRRLGQPGLNEVTGEIHRGDQLPPWARKGLAEKYPGIAHWQCWVLVVGKYEPTSARASRLTMYGVVALLGACVLFGAWWIWRSAARRSDAAVAVSKTGNSPAIARASADEPSGNKAESDGGSEVGVVNHPSMMKTAR